LGGGCGLGGENWPKGAGRGGVVRAGIAGGRGGVFGRAGIAGGRGGGGFGGVFRSGSKAAAATAGGGVLGLGGGGGTTGLGGAAGLARRQAR